MCCNFIKVGWHNLERQLASKMEAKSSDDRWDELVDQIYIELEI